MGEIYGLQVVLTASTHLCMRVSAVPSVSYLLLLSLVDCQLFFSTVSIDYHQSCSSQIKNGSGLFKFFTFPLSTEGVLKNFSWPLAGSQFTKRTLLQCKTFLRTHSYREDFFLLILPCTLTITY
jgi:hypothetical protein